MKWYVISNILLWCFLILQLVIILYLSRLLGKFLNRFRNLNNNSIKEVNLETGQTAPYFKVKDQNGYIISSFDPVYTLLIFINEECSQCKEVLSMLSTPSLSLVYRTVVVSGTGYAAEIIKENLHFVRSPQMFEDFLIARAPFMVMINEEGAVNKVGGYEEISRLIHQNRVIAK